MNQDTARCQFKIAAIRTLIGAGITTPEAMTEHLTKHATGGLGLGSLLGWEAVKGVLEGVGTGVEHVAGTATSALGHVGLPMMIAGPAALGVGAGYLAGKAHNSADVADPKEINRQDLIAEYNRGRDQLKRQTQLRNVYQGL